MLAGLSLRSGHSPLLIPTYLIIWHSETSVMSRESSLFSRPSGRGPGREGVESVGQAVGGGRAKAWGRRRLRAKGLDRALHVGCIRRRRCSPYAVAALGSRGGGDAAKLGVIADRTAKYPNRVPWLTPTLGPETIASKEKSIDQNNVIPGEVDMHVKMGRRAVERHAKRSSTPDNY